MASEDAREATTGRRGPSVSWITRAIGLPWATNEGPHAPIRWPGRFRRPAAIRWPRSPVEIAQSLIRFCRQHTVAALAILSVLAGSMFGATISQQTGLTEEARQVKALAEYRPPVVTKVYAADGRTVIGEFSLERRIPLAYDEIPDVMKNAVIAIEDSRFYKHIGVDPIGIARAGVKNLAAGRTVEGGSTLTQQLTKILFLSPEKTLERKAKEALIALEIERVYSKEQILELYCNQVFLGGGAYGVEAGAQYYFGKALKDCTVEECAVLAAIPKAPSKYSPVLNPKNALERRNLVLANMRDEGFISAEEFARASATPISLNRTGAAKRFTPNDSEFGYAVEEIRQLVEQTYGTRTAQSEGLKIYSTIDAQAQREAVRAVRRGLHAYEARHPRGWRGNPQNVAATHEDLIAYWHHDWNDDPVPDEYIFGLVMVSSGDSATVRFGPYSAELGPADTKLAGKPPGQCLKPGDVTPFKIEKVDVAAMTVTATLAQVPAVAGALVALDVRTGAVRAMVGGYDFALTKFNNATQAERQTGSVFKPFIYTAALESGLTPDSIVQGSPITINDWTPHNYDGSVASPPMPLRTALSKSLNVPAVNTLRNIGVDAGANAVRRFGLPNPMKRVLPSALGATEEPLLHMVSAYSVFPNHGQRAEPYLVERIEDRDGVIVKEHGPKLHRVTTPWVAASMADVMVGVVEEGTAASINGNKVLGNRPLAGKTGTVNDFTDAWFIGYSPSIACGAWIGYPGAKISLGEKETGATAALPMWIDFMEDYLRNRPVEHFAPIPEPEPEILQARAEFQEREKRELAEQIASSAAANAAARRNRVSTPGPQPQPVYVDIPPVLRERMRKAAESRAAPESSPKP